MTTRSIETEFARERLVRLIGEQKLPFTITIARGGKRSAAQNRLQRLWINEIAEQLGDQTPEEIRAYCKLTLGVPILRAENEAFRMAYDEHIRPLPYETKMAMMMEPLDWPVTRLMTVNQKIKYLDQMQQHFLEKGCLLTDPERIAA